MSLMRGEGLHPAESARAALSTSPRGPAQPIGRVLVEGGRLSPHELDRILEFQLSQHIRFGDAGIALGLLSSEDIRGALADQFDYHYLTASDANLSHTLIAAFAPFSPAAEELRSLRTQLQIRWFSTAPAHQALAIVSPSSNDGRSFIAANLAIVFSQLCTRTLLVDADLRKPCQDQLFRLGSRPGLSDILAGRCGPEAITPITALNGLSVLTAGTIPPNPQELFGRSSFNYLMEILRKDYDHLIFDTPPGSLYADVQTVAGECGSALLIAREHHTHATDLIELKQHLQDTGTLVLGSMLNQTEH